MSSSVRAKFIVATKQPGDVGEVKLLPVYAESGENKHFWDATPSGEIRMHITNPAAYGFFSAGDEIYVDFTKASE